MIKDDLYLSHIEFNFNLTERGVHIIIDSRSKIKIAANASCELV